jgi:hypothetical protein
MPHPPQVLVLRLSASSLHRSPSALAIEQRGCQRALRFDEVGEIELGQVATATHQRRAHHLDGPLFGRQAIQRDQQQMRLYPEHIGDGIEPFQ